MFNGPPPLPEKILARVLWLAKMEGNSVVLIAGGSAMLSLFSADWLGVVVGALLVGAGVVVLRGVKLLKAGELRGINWLVRGELVLLNLILIYAAIMLGKLVTGGVDALVSADTRSMLASAGMWGPEQKQLFAQIYRLFYGLLAALSLPAALSLVVASPADRSVV